MNLEPPSLHRKRVRAAYGIVVAVVFLLHEPGRAVLLCVLMKENLFRTHDSVQFTSLVVTCVGAVLDIDVRSVMHRVWYRQISFYYFAKHISSGSSASSLDSW